MAVDNQERFLLSPERNRYIFEQIRKKYLARLSPNKPGLVTAYYLAGQPGSGKTTLREKILSSPGMRENTVVLNTDDLREFHPAYKSLMMDPDNYKNAPILVNTDASIWFKDLIMEGYKLGKNLIFDTTFGSTDMQPFLIGMQNLKENGYGVELHILGVPKEISKLGIHLRYHKQKQENGFGRFVKMETHNLNYNCLPQNILKVIDLNICDKVNVYKKKISINSSGQTVNNDVDKIYSSKKVPNKDDIIQSINNGREPKFNKIESEYLLVRLNQLGELVKNNLSDQEQFLRDNKELRILLNPQKNQLTFLEIGLMNLFDPLIPYQKLQ